jgi:O-antigen/teichoic acid export membrane protein
MEELNAKVVLKLIAQTYSVRVFSLAASFLANILLARLVGPEGKGYLATALFWSGLLAGLLTFGLDSAAVYYVGKFPATFPQLSKSFAVYAMVATILGTAVLITIERQTNLLAGQQLLIWITAGLIFTSLVTGLFDTLYIGLGRLSLTNLVNAVGSAAYLILLLGAFMLHGNSYAMILLGILAIQLCSSGYLILNSFVLSHGKQDSPVPWPAFGRYAMKVYAGNLAGIFYLQTNFMILSLVAPTREVGIYSIAQIFSDFILILPATLVNIMFPRAAAMSSAQVIRNVTQAARLSLTTVFVMAVATSLGASFLVPLVFGTAFKPAAGMIWILCFGSAVGALGMILSIYFNGVGRPEIPSSAAWIGFVVVGALTLLLAPRWGGYGAAAAISGSHLIVSLFMLYRYLRDTREDPISILVPRLNDLYRGVRFVRDIRL